LELLTSPDPPPSTGVPFKATRLDQVADEVSRVRGVREDWLDLVGCCTSLLYSASVGRFRVKERSWRLDQACSDAEQVK